ncbi:MAG TPA: hypothetical protein VJS68_01140, partial [Thermoplasmata archaeon]|nr:hypothetical protein [Thermoplasmata archaeon]
MFGLTRERLAVTLTLGLFLTGSVGLVVPSLILPSGFASEAALGLPGAPHAMAAAPAAVTHGDLVVGPTNSPYVIQAIPSGGTYFEEGNVTVLAGGTLLVENTTFDMLQFVGNSGTVANRLSHLYAISIQGVAIFSHSTITSDTTILNAYVKVPVTVSGAGSLIVRDGSQVAFPGWVTVVGAGASLYVNDSFVMGNPAAAGLPDGPTIGNDTLYAPNLNITGGAHAFFGGSAVVDTYHDNPSASGWPGAVLVNRTQEGLSASAPGHWANFVLAGTGALGIAQADLYPSVASGYVSFNFTTSFATSSTASFANSGTTYALGSVLFTSTSTVVTAALPAAAIHQINTMGIPAFLQATGEFGTGGALFVNLTAPSFQVNVTSVTLQLVPALGYDLSVSGGSTLTAVDTLLGINFNQTVPASGSNKLVLETGSHAFLANVSTTGAIPSGFDNTSAVLPDATSNATFYRWLAVPVMVAPGAPIPGGVATAFYSLDTSQTNNASASYYNTLAPAPGLATWVDQVDAGRGVTAYGTSSSSGFANLLVASTLLSQNDLPDGNYLGEYHVAVNVVGGGTVWQDAGVSPYPT